MDQDIFTLIKEEKDRRTLWVDLGQSHGEIICKGLNESICIVKVMSYNTATEKLEGQFIGDVLMEDGEIYLGHFFLGGEKYYFKASAQVQGGMITIPIASELYHLQRRQNYRVRLPEIYPAFYNIFQVNAESIKMSTRLGDISSQGCKVIYRAEEPVLKMDDRIMGQLVIGERAPLEVHGIVRHVKIQEVGKTVQSYGIEFHPLPSLLESRLFAITMELHKELFTRNI